MRSASGQLTLLAMANQLARVHRRLTFRLPSPPIPVLVTTPFRGDLLHDLLLNTVRSIDPCGTFESAADPPNNSIAVGIGPNSGTQCDWYIGANGAIGRLSRAAVELSDDRATLRGAALASCLGAAAVFRVQLGFEVAERTLSCWSYKENDQAEIGPNTLPITDVGRVLMVGAGAVAASLAYWLHAFGVGGQWTVIDRDDVKVHNLNRGLIFTAADAGWPESIAARKVDRVASLLPNPRAISLWYDQSSEVEEDFDVVLALANDRNVRHFIASRNASVTLQATTGDNWLSQLHRHIAGIDDCVWCRTGEVAEPIFGCSTVPVSTHVGERNDASLPFLSAASGLMLATALQRLQGGELVEEWRNDWRWDFESGYRMASSSSRRCRDDCKRILPAEVRHKINAGTRWEGLDGQVRRDDGE